MQEYCLYSALGRQPEGGLGVLGAGWVERWGRSSWCGYGPGLRLVWWRRKAPGYSAAAPYHEVLVCRLAEHVGDLQGSEGADSASRRLGVEGGS